MKRMEPSIPAKRVHASSSQHPGGGSNGGQGGRGSSKQQRRAGAHTTQLPKAVNASKVPVAAPTTTTAAAAAAAAASSSDTSTVSPTRARRQNAGQRPPLFDPTPPSLLRRVSSGILEKEASSSGKQPKKQKPSSRSSSPQASPRSTTKTVVLSATGRDTPEGGSPRATPEAMSSTAIAPATDAPATNTRNELEPTLSSPVPTSSSTNPVYDEPREVTLTRSNEPSGSSGPTSSEVSTLSASTPRRRAPRRPPVRATVAETELMHGTMVESDGPSRPTSVPTSSVPTKEAEAAEDNHMDIDPLVQQNEPVREPSPSAAARITDAASTSQDDNNDEAMPMLEMNEREGECEEGVEQDIAIDIDTIQEDNYEAQEGEPVASVTASAATDSSTQTLPEVATGSQPQSSIPSHLVDDFAPDSPRKQVTYSPSKQDQQKKFEPIKNASQPKSILKKTPPRPTLGTELDSNLTGEDGNPFIGGGSGNVRQGGLEQQRQASRPQPLSIGAHEEFVKDACRDLELAADDQQKRADAYYTLQSKLRICDDQRHMPEFQSCIRQFAALFARDLEVQDHALLLQYCLRCTGFFLFHPQIVSMLTVDEVDALLTRIVRIAETTTDRSLCSMALYCLGIQQTPLRLWQQRPAVFSTIVPTMVNAINTRARSNSILHEALKSLLNVFHHRPEEMKIHLDIWLAPVCMDLIHPVPGIRSKALDIITFALPHLMTLDGNQVQRALRTFVQDKYDDFFTKLDTRHIQAGDEIYGITVWGCMVSLLGKYLQKTAQLNPVLKIAERCFNSNSPERTEIVMAAFQAWTRFIYVMANCGHLAQERAVQLMMTPIKSCFATENRRRVRLACTNTWIALAFSLDTKLPTFSHHVLSPIMPKVLTDDSEHVRDLGLRFLKCLFAGEGGDKILEGEAFNLHGAKFRSTKPIWSDLVFLRTKLLHMALASLEGAFKVQHRIADSSRDQWKAGETTDLNLLTMPLAHAWESIVIAICTVNNSEKDIKLSSAAVSSLQALLKFARDVSRMDPALLMPKDWPATKQPQFEVLMQDKELAGLILRADVTYYLFSTIIQTFSYRPLMAGRYRVIDDLYNELAQATEAGQHGGAIESIKDAENQEHLMSEHPTTAVRTMAAEVEVNLGGFPTTANTGPSSSSAAHKPEQQSSPLLTPFEYILKTWMELGESVIKTPFDNWFWEGVASLTNFVMSDNQPIRVLFRCFNLLKDIERKRTVTASSSEIVWPSWSRKAHPLLFFELQLKFFSLIAKRISDAIEIKMAYDKVNACTTNEDDENIVTILLYPGYIFSSTAIWAQSEAASQASPETAEYELSTAQWWSSYRAIYFASWKELVQRLVQAKQRGGGKELSMDGNDTLSLLAIRLRLAFQQYQHRMATGRRGEQEDAHYPKKNAGQTWCLAHACVSAMGLVELVTLSEPTTTADKAALALPIGFRGSGRKDKVHKKKNNLDGVLELCSFLFKESLSWIKLKGEQQHLTEEAEAVDGRKDVLIAECTLELMKWLFLKASPSTAIAWVLELQEAIAPWFSDPDLLLPRLSRKAHGQGQSSSNGESSRAGEDDSTLRNECLDTMDVAWHYIAMRLTEYCEQQSRDSTHYNNNAGVASHRGHRGYEGEGNGWPPMMSAAGSVIPPTLSKIRAVAAAAASAAATAASPFFLGGNQHQKPHSEANSKNNSSSSGFKFDSAGLRLLSPLLVTTLGSTRMAIVTRAIEFWNDTFGALIDHDHDDGSHGSMEVLEYPPELVKVLRSLRLVAQIELPGWHVVEARLRAEKQKMKEKETQDGEERQARDTQAEEHDVNDSIALKGLPPPQAKQEGDNNGFAPKCDAEEAETEDVVTASQSSVTIPVYASQSQELSVPAEMTTRTTTIGRQMQKKVTATMSALTPAEIPSSSSSSSLLSKNTRPPSIFNNSNKRKNLTEHQQQLAPPRNPLLDELETMQELLKSPSPPTFKTANRRAPVAAAATATREETRLGSIGGGSRLSRLMSRRVLSREAMSATQDEVGPSDEDETIPSPTKKLSAVALNFGGSRLGGQQQSQQRTVTTPPGPSSRGGVRANNAAATKPATPTWRKLTPLQPYDPQGDALSSTSSSLPLSALSPTFEPSAADTALSAGGDGGSTIEAEEEETDGNADLQDAEEEEQEEEQRSEQVGNELQFERQYEEDSVMADEDKEQMPQGAKPDADSSVLVRQGQGEESQQQQQQQSQQPVPNVPPASAAATALQKGKPEVVDTKSLSVASTAQAPTAQDSTKESEKDDVAFLTMLDRLVQQSHQVLGDMDIRQLNVIQGKLHQLGQTVSQAWSKRLDEMDSVAIPSSSTSSV